MGLTTSNIASPAKRGDICILLEPSPIEKARLLGYHRQLQANLGGIVCPNPHVTCQRFAVRDSLEASEAVRAVKYALSIIEPFPIFAEALFSFYAEFWQTSVLRWRVQNTDRWQEFKQVLDTSLVSLGCPPHYPKTQAATGTAIEGIDYGAENRLARYMRFPFPLFQARRLVFFKILAPNEYEVLAIWDLPEAGGPRVRTLRDLEQRWATSAG